MRFVLWFAKQNWFFPDRKDQAALGNAYAVRAAGRIDYQRAGGSFAGFVGLRFGQDEQMLVTEMFVHRHSRAGFIKQQCRGRPVLLIAVESVNFHAGAKILPRQRIDVVGEMKKIFKNDASRLG